MLNFSADFDALGEISGTIAGLQEATEADDRYLNLLLNDAHKKASDAFDLAAVASSARIPHMFEFGTAGVTPGPTRFTPMQKAAQLWQHRLIGQGQNVEVSFNFRPAVQPNPRPTVQNTGVSTKYLRMLSNRKYVFWNKALVMETGQEVQIRAKRGDFLFVPFYGNPPYGSTTSNRGYMMWNSSTLGPIRSRPGARVVGNFGMIWDGFWGTTGGRMMEADVYKNYDSDFKAAMREAEMSARHMAPKPLAASGTRAAHARAKKRTVRSLLSRAVSRSRGRRTD